MLNLKPSSWQQERSAVGLTERSCLVCRQPHEKTSMLRLVVDDCDTVWPDPMQKAPGRGSYLCMQTVCLAALKEGNLKRAWQDVNLQSKQVSLLFERMHVALPNLCRQYLHQQRHTVATGREAVLKKLSRAVRVMLLFSADAGEALRRQMLYQVEKMLAVGKKVDTLELPQMINLAAMLEREKLYVIALDCNPSTLRLRHVLIWCLALEQQRD
ncbi:MAG: YlxR family protein [Mariprofundaceae bacterium]